MLVRDNGAIGAFFVSRQPNLLGHFRIYSTRGVMQVRLYRHSGYFGILASLDVRVNGKKVASLRRKEQITLQLSNEGDSVQVAMHICTSPVLTLRPSNGSVELECGTPLWTLFDFLSLYLLPPLRGRVFFLIEVGCA